MDALPDPEVQHELLHGPLADLRAPAEVVDAAMLFTGPVFAVRRETAVVGSGEVVRDFTVHHGAVAVLALDEHDRILLINQYRHPVRSRLWEIPAGLLDVPGEDPLAAAQRELAEEADLVAAEWSSPLRFFTSPGQSDEHVTLFEARGLGPAPAAHDREGEEAGIVTRWVALEEALEAALAGRIGNAILLVALFAAAVRRRA